MVPSRGRGAASFREDRELSRPALLAGRDALEVRSGSRNSKVRAVTGLEPVHLDALEGLEGLGLPRFRRIRPRRSFNPERGVKSLALAGSVERAP